jgi:hypothetical protein
LAVPKLPGALEAGDVILADLDPGSIAARKLWSRLFGAQIAQQPRTPMRWSRLPTIKTM